MAYKDPSLLHVDKVLTNVSVRYSNQALVGENLFPVVPVDKQSDKYNVLEKRAFDIYTGDQRPPGAKAGEIPPMSLSRDSFWAEEHALQGKVPVEQAEIADDPDLDGITDETERVTEAILLGREYAMATMVTTAANYAAGHTVTLAGGDQWSTYATSDPIDDLKVARDKVFTAIGLMPNVVAMGYEVASKLEDHPDFLDRIKSGLAKNSDDVMAQLTTLPRFIRGSAMRNTANIGQATTTAFIWGKDVVVAYVPPRPGKRIPAFAYEFNWKFPGGRTQVVDRWYEVQIKSTIVRVQRRYDLRFVAVDDVSTGKATGGYLIKAAIA